ncbi:MAG: L-threonylcarbamoyladenylate synthase [Thermaerobacter sp.]|nr:L-threonylcarbamoyladenylate synthase [Thermaerobacter sp.]
MMTQRLKPDDAGVSCAAALLRAGALVAFPTETVYGLGANAADPGAVARIYAAKGRPADNPLIVHVASPGAIDEWAVPDVRARELARRFWPGPLTLVLPGRGLFGAPTLALRMPAQPVALALLAAVGRPIAAPSANRSGRPSPTSAQAAYQEMQGRIEAVLEGPTARVGIESTVLDLSLAEAALLRPGGISAAQIADALGEHIGEAKGSARSPGTRYRHYAPEVEITLFADDERQRLIESVARALSACRGSWYIGLAETAPKGAKGLLANDVRQLQQELYAALLEAERQGAPVVAVLPPQSSSAAGVRDRMLRAAGGKVQAAQGREE